MTWMIFALGGYFFNALASVFDKLLLAEGRIGSPILYAFYTSLASLFALLILPFGFVFFFPKAMFLGIFSGALFLLGLVAFYEAVKRSEVSRAAPLVGVSVIGFLFLVSLIRNLLSGNSFYMTELFAVAFLFLGGFFLSRPGEKERNTLLMRYVLVAGALMAASLLVLKETYSLSNFASGFVWSRLGMFLTGMSFLLIPGICSQICFGTKEHVQPTKRNASTAGLFFTNKAFGGLGAFLVAYAISLGPVTLVQGLNGTQFAFLFLMIIPLSMRYPKIFREETGRKELLTKIFGIVLLSFGVWLAAMTGSLKGFL